MGKHTLTSLAFLTIAALSRSPVAHADPVADFYTGRQMRMIIGYTSGGGYDLYARVLSKHMGKHLPGNPTITPENMPGAGSLKAANYLYSVAPKDGSVLGIFGRGMAMEPLLGNAAAKFDARKFSWLGSGQRSGQRVRHVAFVAHQDLGRRHEISKRLCWRRPRIGS